MARNFLVTQFHCSNCGQLLELMTDEKVHADIHNVARLIHEGGENAFTKTERTFIEPCKSCINKHTVPAKRLVKALRELQQETNK